MYCYVWSYEVRLDCLQKFIAAYAAEGDWGRFFRRDPAYIRTHLLADLENPARFMTLDFWLTSEACASFRQRFASEFDALDKSFEALTTREAHIGNFDVLGERV